MSLGLISSPSFSRLHCQPALCEGVHPPRTLSVAGFDLPKPDFFPLHACEDNGSKFKFCYYGCQYS